MKIAALYAYHDTDRGWSCPISLITQFQSLGHMVDSFNMYQLENGHGVAYTDAGLRKFLDRQSDYDAFILFDYGMFYSPLLSYIRIPSAMESGDDPQCFPRNFNKAQYFDYIFSPCKQSTIEYRRRGFEAMHLPHWCDPLIHYPMSDVLRRYFIVTTVDEGRGNGIVHFMRAKLKDLWKDDRFFYGVDHTKFMNSGIAVFQCSQFGEWTRRIPEACACGRLVFADRISADTGIYDVYKPHEDSDYPCVVYYDNWKDAVEKILYYNDHQDEAQKIAHNGHELTMTNHTSEIRAKQILEFLEI